jgi:hypothetical protein
MYVHECMHAYIEFSAAYADGALAADAMGLLAAYVLVVAAAYAQDMYAHSHMDMHMACMCMNACTHSYIEFSAAYADWAMAADAMGNHIM